MKPTIFGTLAFGVGAFAPGIALSLAAMWSAPVGEPRPDPTGDLLIVLIYYGYTNGFRTFGFAIPLVFSAAWRSLSTKRAVTIGIAFGLTSPITAILVMALMVKGLLPMFHWAPWLAILLTNGVPGVVLGLLAIGFASLYRRAAE